MDSDRRAVTLKRELTLPTYTGKRFSYLSPDPNTVSLRDIAHSLSMLCRYGGHVSKFYSVAEHSVRVAAMVPKRYLLQAYLHDSAEAYTVDLPKPLKNQLPSYHLLENRVSEVIGEGLGLGKLFLTGDMPQVIKDADREICQMEILELFKDPKAAITTWGESAVKTYKKAGPPSTLGTLGWSPLYAEFRFYDAALSLLLHHLSVR